MADGSIKFPCPKCGTAVPIPFEKLKPGEKLICPGCGITITTTGEDIKAVAMKVIKDEWNRK